MARKRFKTAKIYIRKYSTDSKITSINLQSTTTIKRAYTIVFGKKVYLTQEDILNLNTTITINFE